MSLRKILMLAKKRWLFTNKIRNPRGEGGVVGTVGVTNKCSNNNATPTDATGLAVGTNVSLSYPDWTTSLETLAATDTFISSGLTNEFLSGKVVAAHNSDVVERRVVIGGATGNTNPASAIIYLASSGGASRLADSFSGATLGSISTSSSTLQRFAVDGFTPASSSSGLAVYIEAGATAYFILNHLQEASAAAPVPTVVAGASATGALPTNWSASGGLASQFFGTGVESGFPYADVRMSGTATGWTQIQFDGSLGNIAATVGQAWGIDFGVKLLAGTALGVQPGLKLYSSVPAYIADRFLGSQIVPTSTKQTATGKLVISDAAAATMRPYLQMTTVNAVAYDFTIRIYAPKLVQVAVVGGNPGYLPAAPILPPVGVPGDSSAWLS